MESTVIEEAIVIYWSLYILLDEFALLTLGTQQHCSAIEIVDEVSIYIGPRLIVMLAKELLTFLHSSGVPRSA